MARSGVSMTTARAKRWPWRAARFIKGKPPNECAATVGATAAANKPAASATASASSAHCATLYWVRQPESPMPEKLHATTRRPWRSKGATKLYQSAWALLPCSSSRPGSPTRPQARVSMGAPCTGTWVRCG